MVDLVGICNDISVYISLCEVISFSASATTGTATPCGAPVAGVNTNPIPPSTTGQTGSLYTYTCRSGYESDNVDGLESVCLSTGSWHLDSKPPACRG